MLKNDMVYFLGIGGIGMSALARYFLKKVIELPVMTVHLPTSLATSKRRCNDTLS